MIVVDISAFRGFAYALSILRERQIPYAVREALNATAFDARKVWLATVKSKLTLRNMYTERSMRVVKASGTNISTMASVLGSVADHMGHQERGETQSASGRHGVAIPTSAAAGQGKQARRTRTIRKANWLSAITLAKPIGASRKQRNAVAVGMAARHGGGFVFLDLGQRRGIFRIDGGKRRARIRMVYDLTKRTVVSPPSATLARTVSVMGPRVAPLIRRAVLEQVRRSVVGFQRR